MNKKALSKDTIREIKKSFGRFISIFAIVGIGVAFFAGIKDSVPVMKNTADAYFDNYNFMDLKVMSSIGMSKEDAMAIHGVKGVEGVYASHSIDALSFNKNTQKVFNLMSYPMGAKQSDPNYINQIRVIKGRLPNKADECVIEYSNIKGTPSRIGEKITFQSGTSDALSNSLKNTTYTIVGEVATPKYLSFEKGSSSIGSGKIDSYAFLPDVNFTSKYYSEIYVTIQGAKAMNAYSNDYFKIVDSKKDVINKLGDKRLKQRFANIKEEALAVVQKGKTEYNANKKKFDDGIGEAKQKIADSENKLSIGQANVNTQKSNAQKVLQEKQVQIQQGKQTLQQLQSQYTTTQSALQEQKDQVKQKLPPLQQQLQDEMKQVQNIDQQLHDIATKLADPSLSDTDKEEFTKQQDTLGASKQALQLTITSTNQQITQLQQDEKTAETQVTMLQQQIATVNNKITQGSQQLDEADKRSNQQLDVAQATITSGQKELATKKSELQQEEADGNARLLQAKEKLDQNEADIKDMKQPKWFVLDRHSHASYMEYGNAADRMGAIAAVFPLFFFLVAALVCLTTMTRMVDEQRQEIGTLKALGYSKGNIAMKFVVYAAIASIMGGIFGAIIGMIIFPTVIFNAWGIMYTLPNVKLQLDPLLALISMGLASVITILATIGACYKELMETPALLMRPKAPKNGKRIFLERIPFIWKRFNFIHKVTARNIFRYKKRFLMTVIGISGCSALLLAGFGIRDSIGEIGKKQYGEIYKFDVSLTYKANATLTQKESALKDLKKDKKVKDAMAMEVDHGFYSDDGEKKGISIYVPSNVQEMGKFITLRTRITHQPLLLDDKGAIVTEKLAKMEKLSVGDSFSIDNGSGVKRNVKISGITENYVGHALYMTPTYYKKVFHKTPQNTDMFATLKNTSTSEETAMGKQYTRNPYIQSISFYSSIAKTFENTISSLSIVIIVLIISAGLLAFVVLYNLTNVNISERLREIATIKVLGFYDKEVSAYVYRENIFLTIIGAIVGLVLGIGLHALIMNIAELDTLMFGRDIKILSFIYAFVITMIFTVIVNIFMYRKLKQIPMVESLKSVE